MAEETKFALAKAMEELMRSQSVEAVTVTDVARRANVISKENIIFALAVKLLVMALGLCGVASMWLAVFADSGVAMLCVLNSVRMLRMKTE